MTNTNSTLLIKLLGEEVILLPQKAICFPEHRTLLLSDVHLGKSSHFRREGLALPSSMYSSDLLKLSNLLNEYRPDKVFILGDLFHIGHNSDINIFIKWREVYSSTEIVLVKGNHDRFDFRRAEEFGISVVEEYFFCRKFMLKHFPDNSDKTNDFVIHGHIHPAVRVFGKGRQSAMLSCFHLRPNNLVLPAFGEFTGRHVISPERGDRVFAVIDDGINCNVKEVS